MIDPKLFLGVDSKIFGVDSKKYFPPKFRVDSKYFQKLMIDPK